MGYHMKWGTYVAMLKPRAFIALGKKSSALLFVHRTPNQNGHTRAAVTNTWLVRPLMIFAARDESFDIYNLYSARRHVIEIIP